MTQYRLWRAKPDSINTLNKLFEIAGEKDNLRHKLIGDIEKHQVGNLKGFLSWRNFPLSINGETLC